jgi:hypothetical protein
MQVASVAGNLITGETSTFVSIHVCGQVYETQAKSVKLKQQAIEFNSDIMIPVSDDHLTIRTPQEDVSGSSTPLVPIIMKLHRKGLIDSEVIASGKVMVPLKSSAVDMLSVGLFSPENTEFEIAIARLAVQVTVAEDEAGIIAGIVSEIEELMVRYAKGAWKDGLVVSECLQRFVTSVTPLRKLFMDFRDLFTWKNYVRSWLFLVSVLFMYPLGFIVSCTMVVCLSLDIPIPFLQYLSRFVRIDHEYSKAPIDTPETEADNAIETNLVFLARLMDYWVSLARFLSTVRSEWLLVGFFFLWLLPLNWLMVVAMFSSSFLGEGSIIYARRRITPPSKRKSDNQDTESVTLNENQRWWTGRWSSEQFIGDEATAWETSSGSRIGGKDAVNAPEGYEWSGTWQVGTFKTDQDGWLYNTDFYGEAFHPMRTGTDFVRRRKWTRRIRKIET